MIDVSKELIVEIITTLGLAKDCLDDWLILYVPDEYEPHHVSLAKTRFENGGGTIYRNAELVEAISDLRKRICAISTIGKV